MARSHCQPWLTLPGLNSCTQTQPRQHCHRADANGRLLQMQSSQLIKAQILMRHGPIQAALGKLHHPRKLRHSHTSLWGITLLLPPFSRVGGNLHCLISAVYHGQSWLSYPEAKAALLLSKELPAFPPGQDGCACFPMLLSMGNTQIKACS